MVTTQEMFDAICHHIKYGTNGGNMRLANSGRGRAWEDVN